MKRQLDDTAETGDSSNPLSTLQDTVATVRSTVEKHCAELSQLQQKLGSHASAAASHVEKEAGALRRGELKLHEEVLRMENHAGRMADCVTLNVGGTKFTTSRSTLTSQPSFLSVMFSGRHVVTPSEDGSYFIDRDPTHFRKLLNYLRCGAISVPDDAEAKAEMLSEIDFYQLSDLAFQLRAPTVVMDLGEEIEGERRQEMALRTAFASGQGQQQHPTAGLVSVFSDDGVAESLTFAPDEARRFALILENGAPRTKAADKPLRVAVADLATFRTKFNLRNPNILQRLEPLLAAEPMLVAGGSVLHALTAGDTRTGQADIWNPSEVRARRSDVDIFLYTQSRAEASRICRAIWNALATDDEVWLLTRGKGVVNMICMEGNGNLTVQVVLRLYDSPAEVLLGFDVDCACIGYDGDAVWALPRCLRALKHGMNILNPLHAWPNRATYEYRLVKYASRGFAIAVPGLELPRVDFLALNRSKLCDMKGLARLIKLSLAVSADINMLSGVGGSFVFNPSKCKVSDPIACTALDRHDFVCGDDILAKALTESGYDDAHDAIIPSVFGVAREVDALNASGEPMRSLDIEKLSGQYRDGVHLASATRLLAWAEINDAGPEWNAAEMNVARKLDDAWDMSKRSREYLNASDGELEPRYYVHAYSLNA